MNIANSTKGFATREHNAMMRFSDSVGAPHGLSDEQAEKLLSAFRKLKVVKIDGVNGQYSIKHGAFWDREVMERALMS